MSGTNADPNNTEPLKSIAQLGRVAVAQNGVAVINSWDVLLIAQAPSSATPNVLFTDAKATVADLFSVLPVGYGRLSDTAKVVGRFHTGPGPMEELTLGAGLTVSNTGVITADASYPTMTSKGLLGRYADGTGAAVTVALGTGLSIDSQGRLNVTGSVSGGGGGGGEPPIVITGPNKLLGRASGGEGGYEVLTIGTGLVFTGSRLDVGISLPSKTLFGRPDANTGAAKAITLGSGLTLSDAGVLDATSTAVTSAAKRLRGRYASTEGPLQEIQIGNGLTLSDAGFLSAAQPTISAANNLLGRYSTGSGPAQEVGLGQGLSITDGKLNVIVAGGSVPILSTNNRILGKYSAGSGAAEEITLGAGFSFTGSTLNVQGSFTFGGEKRLLGRGGGSGAGQAQEITLGQGLDFNGTQLTVSFPAQTPPQVSQTKRLLGRFSTGSGTAEEVQLGTGLDIVNGVLTISGGGSGGTGSNLPTPLPNIDLQVLTANGAGVIAFAAAESLTSQRIPTWRTTQAFSVQPSLHMGAEVVILAPTHIPTFDYNTMGDGFVAEFFNMSGADMTPVITGFTPIWPTGTAGKFSARAPVSVRTFSVDSEHFISLQGGVI